MDLLAVLCLRERITGLRAKIKFGTSGTGNGHAKSYTTAFISVN